MFKNISEDKTLITKLQLEYSDLKRLIYHFEFLTL